MPSKELFKIADALHAFYNGKGLCLADEECMDYIEQAEGLVRAVAEELKTFKL